MFVFSLYSRALGRFERLRLRGAGIGLPGWHSCVFVVGVVVVVVVAGASGEQSSSGSSGSVGMIAGVAAGGLVVLVLLGMAASACLVAGLLFVCDGVVVCLQGCCCAGGVLRA